MMPHILTALALINYASFTWAIFAFFKTTGPVMPKRMQQIKIWGTVAMAVHLVALQMPAFTNFTTAMVSISAFVLSFCLFWWAIRTNRQNPLRIAFTEGAPTHLVNKGPYLFVRHPFYASYSITWFAGIVGSGQWWSAIPAIVLIYYYVLAARLEEEQFEESSLAQEYQAYKRQTGMFFPKF